MRRGKARTRIISSILVIAMFITFSVPVPSMWNSRDRRFGSNNGFRLTLDEPSVLDFWSDALGNALVAVGYLSSIFWHLPSNTAYAKLKAEGDSSPFRTRRAAVSSIKTEISTLEEIAIGDIISLAAIPLDKYGNPINGESIKWQTSNPDIVEITNDSQAVAISEGRATLLIEAGGAKKAIKIKVIDRKKSAGKSSRSHSRDSVFLPDEPLLSEQMANALVSTENNLGNPLGQTEMGSLFGAAAARTRERYGSANYTFDFTIASLPGRGIDAAVGLTYNSRVWNKSNFGETLIFDFNIDKNWLSPGFSIGYGALEAYSTSTGTGFLLTAPNGTRTQLVAVQSSGGCAVYESTDGSFIQTRVCGGYAQPEIVISYTDGTEVTFGGITASGRRFPVKVRDRNGNYISISYLQGDTVGKIATIRDTLNRYITFHYDNTPQKKLVAVTVPGYDNSPTPRQTVRFYYEDIDLLWAGRFDSTAQVNAPNAPVTVLRYIYFPGTQSGYRFDYSQYFGVIHKIWSLRGMQVTTDSLSETGLVIGDASGEPGNWAAWTRYNYPSNRLELGPPLRDVPKYNIRTDDWKGRIGAIPETHFRTESIPANCDEQPSCIGVRKTTITAPDNTMSVSISNIRPPEDWQSGLLTETRIVTMDGSTERIWGKTKLFWEQSPNTSAGRRNPRISKIEVTNDAGQTRATAFEYDNFNNQTVIREHDFAAEGTLGAELRRTETIYETGAGWINNRLIRLPKVIKKIVGNETVSKVEYEYDNYTGSNALVDAPEVMQHDQRFNPFNPGTHPCNC